MSTGTLPRRRRFGLPLAILGGIAFALGLVTIIKPAIARIIPIAPVLALLGNDYVLVAVFALAALLVGVAVLVSCARSGISQSTPPDPEQIHNVPRFGSEFDDFLSERGFSVLTGTDRHREVRTRLRKTAIATVMRESNCTRDEARARVERGTWTDEPEAVTFLAESGEPGLTARIVAALRGDSPFQRSARLTAAEIASLDPGEDQ